MKTLVLIPAYNPDEKLIELVSELTKRDFGVLVVDDGSNEESNCVFEKCMELAMVIGYEDNHGKGAALKKGMRFISDNMPEVSAFITADADGQHGVEDICKIRDSLEGGQDFVISVRDSLSSAPVLSKIGNYMSKFMFTIANEHYLPDNQSGLRGFSRRHISWMLEVPGEKYDYELNIILIAEKQGIRIKKVPIQTIYFDNNSASHFKPVKDTVRIYLRYFETNICALIAAVINLLIVVLSTVFVPAEALGQPFVISGIVIVTWGVNALWCLVFERYILFRWINYTPGSRRLVISIFRFGTCALVCMGAGLMKIPFAVAYIIGMIGISIAEYYILKVSYE